MIFLELYFPNIDSQPVFILWRVKLSWYKERASVDRREKESVNLGHVGQVSVGRMRIFPKMLQMLASILMVLPRETEGGM